MKKKILSILFIFLMTVPVISANAVNCGNITNIPDKIPELTRYFINIVEVAVPVILVIMGSIDLFKGITANKEEEIKKGQQILIKRVIIAVIIFLSIIIVKFLTSLAANTTNSGSIVDCIDCFFSSESSCK